ncbi:hypothetical protein PIB30_032514 [Stylosanthes scabra]|uniref:Uncharacterized protein n=1 Tax=Stylosanthes scabra TaxID=79078 RepID=A0ABU6WBX1_9FABA|nr:hypothetical protein [Stylosanthes scabra]
MRKQMREWTRNTFARECYDCWAHQQANSNLVEMPVHKITKLIYENCDKKRPMFYGALKSNLETGSTSQAASPPPPTPTAAPTSTSTSAPEPPQTYDQPMQFF